MAAIVPHLSRTTAQAPALTVGDERRAAIIRHG
jgi:hypothetical protein